MKKNLLLLMLALLLPAFMYGQEQTVSGTVLDTITWVSPVRLSLKKARQMERLPISTVITLSPYPTRTPH